MRVASAPDLIEWSNASVTKLRPIENSSPSNSPRLIATSLRGRTGLGDAREFTIGDLGVGECAGEVVSLFGIEVVRAESQAFDAQCALDEEDFVEAEALAYRAMVSAARALVRMDYIDVTEEPSDVVAEFKKRFFDTELFFDKYAKGKFGSYLLRRHDEGPGASGRDQAAARVEEALLFIEAAHACEARASAIAPVVGGNAAAGETQPSA